MTDSEHAWAGLGSALLSIEVGPVFGEVRIHLNLMSVAEREHLPDQVRVEAGIRGQTHPCQIAGSGASFNRPNPVRAKNRIQ